MHGPFPKPYRATPTQNVLLFVCASDAASSAMPSAPVASDEAASCAGGVAPPDGSATCFAIPPAGQLNNKGQTTEEALAACQARCSGARNVFRPRVAYNPLRLEGGEPMGGRCEALNVVPLAPELQAWVRAKRCWARLRRPTRLANAFLRALVDQAKTRAELRGPGVPADAPEDMPQGSEFLEAKEEFELARAGVVPAKFRGLSAEDSPPPVVRSLEELEAAMEKMGVPREEPMPITRENVRQKSESG